MALSRAETEYLARKHGIEHLLEMPGFRIHEVDILDRPGEVKFEPAVLDFAWGPDHWGFSGEGLTRQWVYDDELEPGKVWVHGELYRVCPLCAGISADMVWEHGEIAECPHCGGVMRVMGNEVAVLKRDLGPLKQARARYERASRKYWVGLTRAKFGPSGWWGWMRKWRKG